MPIVTSPPWPRPLRKDCFPLPNVPEDIIRIIASYLPSVSRACYALSCKAVYSCIPFALKDEELSWPKFFGSMSLAIEENLANHPWTMLLKKVQDKRWKYCSRCLKLHPSSWVSPWCSDPEKGGTPWVWSCYPQVDVVDLCPCLALTWFDGQAITQWLRNGSAENLHFPKSIRDGLRLQKAKGRRFLRHDCRIINDPNQLVRIKLAICLTADNHLQVLTKYILGPYTPISTWPLSPGQTYQNLIAPSVSQLLPLCPHIDARYYILNHHAGYYTECCDGAHDFDLGPGGFITSVRNLGSQYHPENWRKSSRGAMEMGLMNK
ncbi:uncharacterized protein BDV14DRAFT_202209 [Aspergillus stella-maris]|uniref:uncharacterized protein n=1 Tax=Aspergillus stella-maris TaxID=1810926 RepID=UPI003CCD31E0